MVEADGAAESSVASACAVSSHLYLIVVFAFLLCLCK